MVARVIHDFMDDTDGREKNDAVRGMLETSINVNNSVSVKSDKVFNET